MKFKNHCHHKPEDFIGTITLDGEDQDLYIYRATSAGVCDPKGTPHFCLRYSDQHEAYQGGMLNNLIHILEESLKCR